MKSKIIILLIGLGLLFIRSSLLLGQPSMVIELQRVVVSVESDIYTKGEVKIDGYLLTVDSNEFHLIKTSEARPQIIASDAQYLLDHLSDPAYDQLYFSIGWDTVRYLKADFLGGGKRKIENENILELAGKIKPYSVAEMLKDVPIEPFEGGYDLSDGKRKISIFRASIFFLDPDREPVKGIFYKISPDSIWLIMPHFAKLMVKGNLRNHIKRARPGIADLPMRKFCLEDIDNLIISKYPSTVLPYVAIGTGAGILIGGALIGSAFALEEVDQSEGWGRVILALMGIAAIPAGFGTGYAIGNFQFRDSRESYQIDGLAIRYQRVVLYENWRSIHTQLQNLE